MGEENLTPEHEAAQPSESVSESVPKITLFGKQMEMLDREAETREVPRPVPPLPGRHEGRREELPRAGYDAAGERRTFWMIVGALGAAIVLGFIATLLLRTPTAPPAQPAETRPSEASPVPQQASPAAPAVAQPEPRAVEAAPAATAPAVATPEPPSNPIPTPSASATVATPAAAAAVEPPKATQPRGAAGRVKARSSRAAPRPAARRAVPDPYIERLRQEREQYERDKARGKYREFPP